MNLSDLIPAGVGIGAAIAICTIAFVSGTARGFSGFGSALIFKPLASSVAAPRLVATLLLIIDFVAATPLLPNAWRHADRKATAVMVLGALVGVPLGTYFLIRLDPVTARAYRGAGAPIRTHRGSTGRVLRRSSRRARGSACEAGRSARPDPAASASPIGACACVKAFKRRCCSSW